MKKVIITTIVVAIITSIACTMFGQEKSVYYLDSDTNYIEAHNKMGVSMMHGGEGGAAAGGYSQVMLNIVTIRNKIKERELMDVQIKVLQEQLKMLKRSNEVMNVYDNLLKTAPALIKVMRADKDPEIRKVAEKLEILIRVLERPLTEKEVKKVTTP